MSSNGSPRRYTRPMPSPVSVCAFEVVLYIFPEPPVAITTLGGKDMHLSGGQFIPDHSGDLRAAGRLG